MRGNHKGPQFVFSDGRSLNCEEYSLALNNLFKQLHIDSQCYNTYCFHIGAATSATYVPEKYRKMLGRWTSDAYVSYTYQDTATGAD